jgi:predicted RNase H-like nuclease
VHFVGVDGCRAGWVAVALTEAGEPSHLVAPSIAEVAFRYPTALALVDVPIGLRGSERDQRRCDVEARAHLGRRRSSVFAAPCRSALGLDSYEAASAENHRCTGRKLSRQSFAITPRILDVEEYLRRSWASGPVIREMHPEVCFWALAARPMAHSKRTEEGAAERLAVLSRHLPAAPAIVADVMAAHRRSVVRKDDVIDALAGAVTALVGVLKLRTLPETPERDARNLRMEMVYAGEAG